MIAVLDFGSQYTHLITRRMRELKVKAEIFEHDVSGATLKEHSIEGIILSGGPATVFEKNAPSLDKNVLKLRVPILGICYGHQLLAHIFGGKVRSGDNREYGQEIITIKRRGLLFYGLTDKEEVWFSHGVTVYKLPKGFDVLASTKNAPVKYPFSPTSF